MVVLVAWSKVVAFPGTGEWTCSNCGKTDCWSTRYSCCRCGVLRYFDGSGMGQGHFGAGPGKGGGVPGFKGQRGGAGMSGVRFVIALDQKQTHVSTGNPHTGKAMACQEVVGRGPVPGAGVGAGGNRVRFQENPELRRVRVGRRGN